MPLSHVVLPGECIASIAFQYGFAPLTLWDLPENRSLREQRRDPNVLVPGDVVHVPDKRTRVERCATGRVHTFRRKSVPERLELQLLRDDVPRAGEPYVLEVDGVELERARTDEEGRVKAWISPGAREAKLRLTDDAEVVTIALGHLLPADDWRGAQQRLRRLGLYRGECTGEPDEDTVEALVELQLRRGIEPTGELDAATQQALREASGGSE